MNIRRISKPFFVVVLLVFMAFKYESNAQNAPFLAEIQKFKKLDSLQPPPENAILFIGSSSFTNWTDVKDYFPEHTIINRGFGGSSLTDLIRYSRDIVFRYRPKQIVIYCGENDLAGNSGVTGEIVFNRFKELFTIIREEMPAVPIVYISMKPSPSRLKYLPEMRTGNRLIKNYLRLRQRTKYIDVYNAMLTKKGEVMEELFLDDQLHMNEKGYNIWQKAMTPYLIK